ncbi:MAG: lysyl oxidase family protein [Deltaproteobacteria bacterium]
MQISRSLLAGALVGELFACSGETENTASRSVGAGALQSDGSGSESGTASDSSPSSRTGPESVANDGGPRAAAEGAGERRTRAPAASGQGAAGERTSSFSEGAGGPLPDLVLDAAYLVDSTRFDIQRIDDPCAVQQRCATGLGERRVVRFGSRMGNIGEADFVLGAPEQANPLWTLDACTDRFSLSGFARYELRDAETGEQVLLGTKNEFCMTDAEPWIPESGATCQTYSCTRQGIRPECADNYGTDLPCQWLDVTDVPPGSYELRVTVNAERTIEELDYDNDSVQLRLRIDANGGSVER